MSSGYSASLLTGNGSGSAADCTVNASMTSSTSPVGRFGLTVSSRAPGDRAGNGDDAFQAQRSAPGEQRRRHVDHALRDAVMVAQIDEQQLAMVALAVHPAGQTRRLPGIGEAERAAGMGAIGMHRSKSGRPVFKGGRKPHEPAPLSSQPRSAAAFPSLPRRRRGEAPQ